MDERFQVFSSFLLSSTSFSLSKKYGFSSFQGEHKTYIYILSFLHIDMTRAVEILLLKYDRDLPIPYSQYHGSWCPGDARSRDISSYDIDIDKLRKFGPRTLRVKHVPALRGVLNCKEHTATVEKWQ